MHIAYETGKGAFYHGTFEEFANSDSGIALSEKVNLIFTSPPFPLNRKKKYGNLKGEQYIEWIAGLASAFRSLLTKDGSIVIEMGNAWVPSSPTMSTLALKALLSFIETGEFHLCQQFIWHNPARLPSPAQWVNIERIRVKDAFTHLWWMSTSERPKADNRHVLKAYSESMRKLLDNRKYNGGPRPSEHVIGTNSFLTEHEGAIPSNVITIANTHANTDYLRYCKDAGLKPHPARMPPGVVEFFVKLLTDEGDLVLDPFAGSNTTGFVAESLCRRWIAVEPQMDYIEGSRGRFALDTIVTPTIR